MSAIDNLFDSLRKNGRKALMPFVAAGDPDLDFTASLLETMVENGAALCELGIPYSDPIADGPVIQSSYTRALENRVRLDDIFDMLRPLAPRLSAPVVTMASSSIVYRRGPARYVADAKTAGAAGTIVPDLPHEEAAELAAICRESNFSLIQLVTPNTPRDRAVEIARSTSGFIYYVSVAGVTGGRREISPAIVENLRWLRGQTDLPICVGFGISTPDQARLLAPSADGLIVGSAIVRRASESLVKGRKTALDDGGRYVGGLAAALSEPV